MSKVRDSYQKAIVWVKNHTLPEMGVVVTSKKAQPYPEVTGYLIPTLIEVGEKELALKFTKYLLGMQRPNGAFAGPDGKEYVFDSGQCLRGLIAAHKTWPEKYLKKAIKLTADYLLRQMNPQGQFFPQYDNIPEAVLVYVLPALAESDRVLNTRKYSPGAYKALKYYLRHNDLEINPLTHFVSYFIDGCIDMGQANQVKPYINQIFAQQKPNGSFPAYPDVGWVCSVGTGQLAIIGYKVGREKEADAAVNYLCSVQNTSGGFAGSLGWRAKYFPKEEISWANKFFLDAIQLKISSYFDKNATDIPKNLKPNDPRLNRLFSLIGNLNGKKILDAGCGNGRFASQLKKKFPACHIYGVDISNQLLKLVPKGITTQKGSLLNLPYPDGYFDLVICIETLEHTINVDKAISEFARVLKISGQVVIIDKNIHRPGKVMQTDFERWFFPQGLAQVIGKYFTDVRSANVGAIGRHPHDFFISWSATKKPVVLNDKEWYEAIAKKKSVAELVQKIKRNEYPVWIFPLLKSTYPNDSILEMGSGSGELAAILALYKRRLILMDYSPDSLEYSQILFKTLELKADFIQADILNRLPMKPDSVGWVFSSGVLEHFSSQEIVNILKESARVCKKGVISLVPNAQSLFYRLGKQQLEQGGTWEYGKETPEFSMKKNFEQAGLVNIHETTIAPYHSLHFLNTDGFSSKIKDFYDSLSADELASLNQGYLLFTYGEKRKAR